MARRESILPEPQRFLIVKPSSLGDIVHAMPAAAALRRGFPGSRIAWLVKKEWADILTGNPDIDEIIPVDFSLGGILSVVAKLRRERFDTVIDMQGLLRSSLIALISGASRRIGFARAREGARFWYTHRIVLPGDSTTPWRLLPVHAIDRNLALVGSLGVSMTPVSFHLPDLPGDRDKIEAMFLAQGIQKGQYLVAVAPLDRSGIRSWPLDRFLDVASQLAQDHDVRIVVVGSPDQRWMVERFRSVVADQLVDLVGKTTLRQLGAVFRRVSVVLANDSAPMHIAGAVGTPVVALFGPTSSARGRPYGEGHRVLVADIPCRPCGKNVCHNAKHMECLSEISSQAVLEGVRQILYPNRQPISL